MIHQYLVDKFQLHILFVNLILLSQHSILHLHLGNWIDLWKVGKFQLYILFVNPILLSHLIHIQLRLRIWIY